MQFPADCQSARALGESQLWASKHEPGPTCRAILSCLGTLRSQLAAGIQYLKNNPAVFELFRNQVQVTDRTNGNYLLSHHWPAMASGQRGSRFDQNARSALRIFSCNILWDVLNREWLPPSDFSVERFLAAGQSVLAKVRTEFTNDEVEYADLMAFNDRYTGVEVFERAYAAYRHAFQNDDIAGMIRGRPAVLQGLEQARTRKQLLTRQSAQISRHEQTLSDLATSLDRESLNAFADQQMRVGLDELRHELQQLGQTTPAKRGDISTKLEAFDRQVRQKESEVEAARSEKARAARIQISLIEDESATRRLLESAARPELKPAFDEAFVNSANELIGRLRELQGLDLWVIRDKQDEVQAGKSKLQDLQKRGVEVQVKYDRAKMLDDRRQTVLANASRILREFADPEKEGKLSSDGLSIRANLKRQYDELSELDAAPLITRPDFSNTLTAAQGALDRIQQFRAEIAEVMQFIGHLRELNSRIDKRGRRLLNASTSAQLEELNNLGKGLSAAKIPLAQDDAHQLAGGRTRLAEFASAVDPLMDQEEIRFLMRELPSRSGSWAFRSYKDKITDEEWPQAIGHVEGGQAKYELRIGCRRSGPEFLVATFESSGTDGRRIPWDFDGPSLSKRVRLRIDSNRAFAARLVMHGYGNQGQIMPRDITPEFNNLLHSSGLVLADVFEDEQVEFQTNYPTQFRRLCELLAGPSH